MKKKMVSILLAACMVMSMTACGDSEKSTALPKETGETEAVNNEARDYGTEDFITVDFYSQQSSYQGLQSGWYGAAIKEKFNMELNIISPIVSGGGDSLYQTRSAAGNLGDIVCLDYEKMKECVDAGLVIDLTPYLEGKENIAKYQTAIDNMKEYIGEDGIYAIPLGCSTESATKPLLDNGYIANATFMPWKYYSELGCPDIQDTNDLLDVLAQMVENHPTTESGKRTYGISLFKDWDWQSMYFAERLASNFGFTQTTASVFTNGDATQTQLLIDDNGVYHEALKVLFEANQKGLLDPDSSAQTYDNLLTKFAEQQVMFCPIYWMSQNTLATKEAGTAYAYIPVATQKIVNQGYNPYGGDGVCLGIGSNVEDPERLIDFLEWTCSAEGLNYFAWNVEGLTYEIEDGNQIWLSDQEVKLLVDGEPVPEEFGGGSYKEGAPQTYASIGSKFDTNPETGEPYDHTLWESYLKDGRTAMYDEWTEKFGTEDQLSYLEEHNMLEIVPGNNYMPEEESSEMANKRAQCNTVVVETSWKMVYAKDAGEFDQLWEDMKEELTGFGYEDVIAADMAIVKKMAEARAEAITLSE